MGRPKGSKNRSQSTGNDTGEALAIASKDPIASFLNQRKASLEGYAIRKYDHESFMRSAFLAIAENNRLAASLKTGAGQRSLYNALRYAAATGLSLNPQQGKAALVPYRNKDTGDTIVNYQIMKNGLIDLVMESGQVKDLIADLVRENDKFDIQRTQTNDTYVFVPARKARGEIDGYFAAITLKDGRTHIAYLAIEEVEKHRDRYNASKALGERSPWSHSFDGMAVKTVIKKLLRNLHLSPEAGAAISVDDASEFGDDVIDMVSEDPPIREGAPKTKREPEPARNLEIPPASGDDDGEPGSDDGHGDSPEDVEARIAASDSAADEQSANDGDEDTDTEEADDSVI